MDASQTTNASQRTPATAKPRGGTSECARCGGWLDHAGVHLYRRDLAACWDLYRLQRRRKFGPTPARLRALALRLEGRLGTYACAYHEERLPTSSPEASA